MTIDPVKLRGAVAMLMASSTIALSAPAVAQSAQADNGDIIVTAQKTGAQSVLDVPATITALGADTLNAARVQDLGDIAKLNPSINFQESLGRAFNFISIRGVSSTEGGTPTVQVYVDGFTSGIARSQLNTTLFDLERVEVLEGPQATLYGRNSIGGVINYVTKKPGNKLEAQASLMLAEYGESTATARVAGPIAADHLFAEASVAYHQRNGYLTNTATGADIDTEEDFSARAALRAVFDRTTIDLSGTYSRTNDGCADCSYVPTGYQFPIPIGLPPYNTQLRDGTIDLNAKNYDIDQDSPHYLNIRARTFIGTIEHDFGGVTLTSITGYSRVKTRMAFDIDRTANRNPLINSFVGVVADDKSYSEELRLSGGGEGQLRWLIGGYYSRIRQAGTSVLGGFPIGNDLLKSKNAAVFANAELPIGDFTIGAGLRYDHEENDASNVIASLAGSAKSNEVLPRVTASYKLGERTMVYATVSKGYKSGGVNTSTATVPRTFAPEYLWNYEAGIKGKFLDNKLTLALSGFHMDWTDRQVQLNDPTGVFVYQANLGKAQIDGAELSANLKLAPGLTVDGGLTYLHARIKRYIDGSGVSTWYGVNPDLKGNTLPQTPSIRASLSPQWVTPILDGKFDLRTRADVVYTGKRYFDAQNLLKQDAFALVNLYAGIENDHFEIGVFANNAFDQGYRSAGNLSVLTGPLLTAGTPRVIGMRARVKI
jgi:iron complex outermembrane receptor protein